MFSHPSHSREVSVFIYLFITCESRGPAGRERRKLSRYRRESAEAKGKPKQPQRETLPGGEQHRARRESIGRGNGARRRLGLTAPTGPAAAGAVMTCAALRGSAACPPLAQNGARASRASRIRRLRPPPPPRRRWPRSVSTRESACVSTRIQPLSGVHPKTRPLDGQPRGNAPPFGVSASIGPLADWTESGSRKGS